MYCSGCLNHNYSLKGKKNACLYSSKTLNDRRNELKGKAINAIKDLSHSALNTGFLVAAQILLKHLSLLKLRH